MVASARPRHLTRGDAIRLVQPHRIVEGKVINSSEDVNGYKIEMTDALGHYLVWRENLDNGFIEKIYISLMDEVSELIHAAKVHVSFEETPLEQLSEYDRTGIVFDNGSLRLVETDIEADTIAGKKRVPGYQVYRIRSTEVINCGNYRILSDAVICVVNSLTGGRIGSWEQARCQDKDMPASSSRIKL